MASVFRSLRWRLQLWHAIILFIVVSGMVGVLSWEITRAHWDTIDEELVSAARLLEGSLRLVPQPILDSLSKDIAMPPGPSLPPVRGRQRPNQPRQRPDADRREGRDESPQLLETRATTEGSVIDWEKAFGAYEIPESQDDWEGKLSLPNELPRQIGRPGNQLYYVIWRPDGTILKQSNFARQVPLPTDSLRDQLNFKRYVAIQRGSFRELLVEGPHRSILCVGRSVAIEFDRIRGRQMFLALAGLVTFVLGLAGGWWMSRSAMEPIKNMSDTAAQISATSLSQRMNLAGVDSELSELGLVLNNMLDRLDGAFELQRQFTADASHELRTPLAGMLATTELALAKERSPEEYRKHLQACFRLATRMQKLIESLLALARLDNDPEQSKFEPVSISQVLENSVQSVAALSQEKSIQIHKMDNQAMVLGNAVQLERVFSNLLENGIRYNHDDGQIWIDVRIEESRVLVLVRDNGIGIDPIHHAKLMDRFYRVDAVRGIKANGYGLGLSIANRIIELHSGTIQVDSAIGKGATFTVSLPIYSVSPSKK